MYLVGKNKFSVLSEKQTFKYDNKTLTSKKTSNLRVNKIPLSVKTSTMTKDVTTKTTKSRPKVVILSDSHGRGVSKLLQETSNSALQVISWVKPNANMEEVLKDASSKVVHLENKDSLVVIGGTNNFVNGHCGGILDELDSLLRTRVAPQIVVVGVPQRYDSPSLASAIHHTNVQMCSLTSRYNNATFLPLTSLTRPCYTRHGMHLNEKGKKTLSSLLFNSICSFHSSSTVHSSHPSTPVKYSSHQTKSKIQKNNSCHYNKRRSHTKDRIIYNQTFLETHHRQYEVPWREMVGVRAVWARAV